MTIRKLLELLRPYAADARDGEECEVTIGDDLLTIDMGSDIHRYDLNRDDGYTVRHGRAREGG
jgi:hypothetical protein